MGTRKTRNLPRFGTPLSLWLSILRVRCRRRHRKARYHTKISFQELKMRFEDVQSKSPVDVLHVATLAQEVKPYLGLKVDEG